MKSESVGHHAATQALVLSVVGVTAIVLIASLIFLILQYCFCCSQIALDKKRLARGPTSLVKFADNRGRVPAIEAYALRGPGL